MSFSIGIETLGSPTIALGGRNTRSYIWSEMAEIQSGPFPLGGLNGNRFGCYGVRIVGTQASGGKPPRLPVTLRSM